MQLTIDLPFAIGDRVHFICGHALKEGTIARLYFDGKDVRAEISRETGVRPLWAITLNQIAKVRS